MKVKTFLKLIQNMEINTRGNTYNSKNLTLKINDQIIDKLINIDLNSPIFNYELLEINSIYYVKDHYSNYLPVHDENLYISITTENDENKIVDDENITIEKIFDLLKNFRIKDSKTGINLLTEVIIGSKEELWISNNMNVNHYLSEKLYGWEKIKKFTVESIISINETKIKIKAIENKEGILKNYD